MKRRGVLGVPRVVASALLASVVALFVANVGCRGPSSTETQETPASPQASAMPALLAATPTAPASGAIPASPEGGGPPPVPLRGDVPLEPDMLARESIGYTVSAVLRPADVAAGARAPEVNAAGIDAAKKRTELRLAIDLAPARMRVVLGGHGFVVPSETEIRARADRYGHVLLWPGLATYRPLAPGALRALIGERRFDVAPLAPADVVIKDDLGKRIGIRTRRVEVGTRAAKATFEIGRLPDLAEGGALLCRMLLDLMNAPPSTAVCGVDELPVRAELRWHAHGSLTFELTGVLRKAEMASTLLLAPPPSASFAGSPPAVSGVQPMLSPQELGAFRLGPVDVTPPTGQGAPATAQPGAAEGLTVVNATDELRLLYVDGVAAAWAAPGARGVLPGLLRGRYVAQWRTFLGEIVEPPSTVTVPGIASVGVMDAGAK